MQLLVPPLVRAGTSATLLCLYDLEQAPLYSVKWYRGQHEFFRYMPKENPQIKAFQIAGFYVDVSSFVGLVGLILINLKDVFIE